jgi:hypothetical protein
MASKLTINTQCRVYCDCYQGDVIITRVSLSGNSATVQTPDGGSFVIGRDKIVLDCDREDDQFLHCE